MSPLLPALLFCSLSFAQEPVLISPDSLPVGETFEVSWSGDLEKGAVIIVAQADGTPLPGASYAYISPKRKVKLEAPPKEGSYLILQGSLVGRGLSNGKEISLPAGSYILRYSVSGTSHESPFKLEAGKAIQVEAVQ